MDWRKHFQEEIDNLIFVEYLGKGSYGEVQKMYCERFKKFISVKKRIFKNEKI